LAKLLGRPGAGPGTRAGVDQRARQEIRADLAQRRKHGRDGRESRGQAGERVGEGIVLIADRLARAGAGSIEQRHRLGALRDRAAGLALRQRLDAGFQLGREVGVHEIPSCPGIHVLTAA